MPEERAACSGIFGSAPMHTLILRRLQVRQPLLDLKCVRLVIGRIRLESSGAGPDPLVAIRLDGGRRASEGVSCTSATNGLEGLARDSGPPSETAAEVGVLAAMGNHAMHPRCNSSQVVCDGLMTEAERFSEWAQGEVTELRVATPETRPSTVKFSVYLLLSRGVFLVLV